MLTVLVGLLGTSFAGRLASGSADGLLVALLAPTPSTTPVYDQQADGFAAAIVPAFVVLAILALVAGWVSRRPCSRSRARRR